MAQAGDEGVVIEQRGWNMEFGRRISRYVHVWIDTRDGKPYRRNISIDSRLLSPLY